MDNSIRLKFSSSIEDIKNVNESFDSAVLRICYTGANRNGSLMRKDTIEKAIPTMFNCPVVCNYDIEADTIGGHDMDVVTTDAGEVRLVNLTNAIGVIPSEANTWWETVMDGDVEHEYLVTEVILWKRSPAYMKLIADGITSQSMEIAVKEGRLVDNIFVIEEFVFLAFCLLGEDVEPCFEGASLQMFSTGELSKQFSTMMQELKESFSTVQSPTGVDIQDKPEGGKEALDEKMELMAQYNLTVEALDFSLEDFSLEELKEKFDELKAKQDAEKFALAEQFREELIDALRAVKVETAWGEMSRYCYMDYDSEAMEVYAYDAEDWKLYGFAYSMNGDNVIIDFESKKRKKCAIVDYDNGEQTAAFATVCTEMAEQYTKNDAQWKEKYESVSAQVESMTAELETLKQYKADVENAELEQARENVFAQFEDLAGVEAFENLRNDCGELSTDELEEKCFAIRGRTQNSKFSVQPPKAPKLPVNKAEGTKKEPYGGLFVKYGVVEE